MLFKTLKRRLCTEEIGILESLSASKTPLRTHEVSTTTETLRSFVPQASLIHILFEAGTWPWRSLWYGNKHVSFSTLPAWPNGYGVPLLRVRLWVRVPSWVHTLARFIESSTFCQFGIALVTPYMHTHTLCTWMMVTPWPSSFDIYMHIYVGDTLSN